MRRDDGLYELADSVFGLWLRWRRPGGSVLPMTLVGDEAERSVADHLARLGFEPVYQSRASRGPFDLLALRSRAPLAVQVKHALHHCPVIASLACPDDGRLPDGTTLAEALAKLRAAEADVVGINCVNGPAAAVRLLAGLADAGPLAAFPSAGLPARQAGGLAYPATPQDFAQAVRPLAQSGVRLLGGCCGTTAAHVAAIAETLGVRPDDIASY